MTSGLSNSTLLTDCLVLSHAFFGLGFFLEGGGRGGWWFVRNLKEGEKRKAILFWGQWRGGGRRKEEDCV